MGRHNKGSSLKSKNARRKNVAKARCGNESTAPVRPTSATSPVGRRILTIGSWLDSLALASMHGKSCVNADLFFNKEIKVGLRCRVMLACHACSWNIWICNDKVESEVTLPINEALVWGTNAAGSNYEAVKDVCTVMDIPFPSHNYYFKQSEKVVSKWDQALLHELAENGKAEAKASTEANDTVTIGQTVYPSTAVYVDGGWSTRSYGHSCKSKAGVAVIIGAKTKKLLYIGIKNMFCVVCKRSSNANVLAPKHTCYKNWNESVSATNMETQILVEGFRASLESSGLVYKTLIGDGDSSVYSTLLNAEVYPGIRIEKIECVNHVLKNLNKSLIKLVSDTKIPVKHRKLLKARQSRIGKDIRSAINYRHKNNRNDHMPLRKDILNVPHHVFGNHQNCDKYFCSSSDEVNLVPEVQKTIMWLQLFQIINRVAFLSSRLIHNLTSNLPESCMSRVAKYNHGKRINVTQRFGWHAIATAAALSFSKGKAFYADTFKSLTGNSPSRKWVKAKELAKKSISRVRNQDLIRKNRFAKRNTHKPVSDFHYGPNAASPDFDDAAMELLIRDLKTRLQVTVAERDLISSITLDQANSDDWTTHRCHRITASIAGEIFSLQNKTSNQCLIKRMLYSSKNALGHLPAIKHGKSFEKEALEAYKETTGNDCVDSGLFVSLENGIFAASPDGLVGDDGLVEVKCPWRMIGHPPEHMPQVMKKNSYLIPKSKKDPSLEVRKSHKYYKQAVMQLHVTGRNWCDFVIYSIPSDPSCEPGFAPFIQRIYRHQTVQLWTEMKTKLGQFFEQDLAPEIVNPRVRRGMPIRQPTYRQDAIKEAQKHNTSSVTLNVQVENQPDDEH